VERLRIAVIRGDGIGPDLAVPALLAISAIFPPAVRETAGGLAYNVTQALFGGTGAALGVAHLSRDVFDRRYTPTAEPERRAPSDRFTREPAPAADRVALRR
jgi:hypothetical protein